MPFNLAVFNINAAEKVINQFPEIEDWYIGGHSLGGAMAASFLEKNQDDIRGLILLAAYSTTDFSDTDIEILSIFGSEDKVLNLEKYAEYKPNFSKNTREFVIEGGNHAGFGFYGNQEVALSTRSVFPNTLKSQIKQLCVLVATTWSLFPPLLLTI